MEIDDELLRGLIAALGPVNSITMRIERLVRSGGVRKRSSKLKGPPPPPVSYLRLEKRSKGWYRVSINEIDLRLPKTLAVLLAALSAEPSDPKEGIAAFKAPLSVRNAMQSRLGRRMTRHALAENTRRLRVALARAALDPRLVETSAKQGLRFRVYIRRST